MAARGIGQAAHLRLARRILEDSDGVSTLARCLAQSRYEFGKVFEVSEPFYPLCERTVATGRGIRLDSGHDLAVRLAGTWLVEGHPDLDFIYMDREILVSRRTDHPNSTATSA